MAIMNTRITIKKAICLSAIPTLLAVTLSVSVSRSANGSTPQVNRSNTSVYQFYAKNGHVPLRRVPVLDGGTKLTYVWIFLGDPQEGLVYGSLSSPQLRKRLLTYPKGTVIEDVRFGWDPVVFHRVMTKEDRQNEREGKDFSDFCTAHGFKFIETPTI